MHEAILFVSVVAWYFIYRTGANSEIELLAHLHSAARLPDDFEVFSSYLTVVLLSIGLTVSFGLMAFFVNYFPLFCLFCLFVSVQDLIGNRKIMIQLRNLQQLNNSDIPDTDKKKSVISQLREEAYKYWIYNPQLERITLFLAVNIIGLLIYLYIAGVAFSNMLAPEPRNAVEAWIWFILRFRNPELASYNPWIVLSYAVSVCAIIWNEYTMYSWRRERNKRLEPIFAKEAELDEFIARGEPPNLVA
jgi:hypothetical protein